MDLAQYSKKEILLSALRSEIDSEKAYLEMAKRVKNFLLADRLTFLAQEEKKHAAYLIQLYKSEFSGEQPKVPAKSLIPLPEIDLTNESLSMADLLEQAKEAENVAAVFYSSMISIFAETEVEGTDEKEQERRESVRESLLYLATMEIGHSRILETEAEHARANEHDTMEWDMIHMGP